jgi:hypothetical protein
MCVDSSKAAFFEFLAAIKFNKLLIFNAAQQFDSRRLHQPVSRSPFMNSKQAGYGKPSIDCLLSGYGLLAPYQTAT